MLSIHSLFRRSRRTCTERWDPSTCSLRGRAQPGTSTKRSLSSFCSTMKWSIDPRSCPTNSRALAEVAMYSPSLSLLYRRCSDVPSIFSTLLARKERFTRGSSMRSMAHDWFASETSDSLHTRTWERLSSRDRSMPICFSSEPAGAATTFSSVRIGLFSSAFSDSSSRSTTAILRTTASAAVLQNPLLSTPACLESTIFNRVDDTVSAPMTSAASSSPPSLGISYPMMSSFSLCQKMYLSTRQAGRRPAMNRDGISVWVPISEFRARVMSSDGSGATVVMGMPPDMARTPPTRSGYGSPETSCRHKDMLEVYSRVRRCRRPYSFTLKTVTTGGLYETTTSFRVCVKGMSPCVGFSIHPIRCANGAFE
mmetsp:Transcript_49473/g.105162  ORF Transcript_49473/g.105162 Transcript_49473/m.105162 type:complete len:367 (+) Transcript_49473:1018-2118(+)